MSARAKDSIVRLYDSTATPCGCVLTAPQAKRILRRFGVGLNCMNSGGVPFTSVRRVVGPTDTLLTCLSCGCRWLELPGYTPSDAPPAVRPKALRGERAA